MRLISSFVLAPVAAASVLPVWRRSWLGRYRLNHNLRHSGLTWAAATGASVAELMRRGGHASPAAALRYQHATEDRDRALADALAELAPVTRILARWTRDGWVRQTAWRETSRA